MRVSDRRGNPQCEGMKVEIFGSASDGRIGADHQKNGVFPKTVFNPTTPHHAEPVECPGGCFEANLLAWEPTKHRLRSSNGGFRHASSWAVTPP